MGENLRIYSIHIPEVLINSHGGIAGTEISFAGHDDFFPLYASKPEHQRVIEQAEKTRRDFPSDLNPNGINILHGPLNPGETGIAIKGRTIIWFKYGDNPADSEDKVELEQITRGCAFGTFNEDGQFSTDYVVLFDE